MSLRETFELSITICEADNIFQEYAAREKFLAFIFTYIQNLQKEQSKFIPLLKNKNIFIFPSDEVRRVNKIFEDFTHLIIENGMQTGEFVRRPFFSKYYSKILWNVFLNILNFWANDLSNNKEETDVMIEKSVHFAFDLLSPNAFDSGLDMVKFLFQKR